MRWLRADFHIHTADDPIDDTHYSAEMLIDAAVKLNLDVVAIACHERVAWNTRLGDYAQRRGLLLVPAAELVIEGKHVLALNPDQEQAKARTFDELRELGRRDAAFVAPHPFYPEMKCLHGALTKHSDLFDAVEYSSVYRRCINFNRKAVRVAKRLGLPLVGNSDLHVMPYAASTFTWVEGEATVPSVINSIRKGRVRVETRPMPLAQLARAVRYYMKHPPWSV